MLPFRILSVLPTLVISSHWSFSLQDMTDKDVVGNHFDRADSNQDGELDSREWLGYLRQKDQNLKRDKSTRLQRYEHISNSRKIRSQ